MPLIRLSVILLCLIFSNCSFANTITISTAPSSVSGWTYTAGVITASSDVTINNAVINAYLVSGNLTVVAGTNISVAGDISPALGAGVTRTLTLKAGGNLVLENSGTISCSSGSIHLVLWSDADATNGGHIYLKSASVLNSKGGHIWLGGGSGSGSWNGLTVGDGFAKGSSATVIPSAELNTGANASGFRNGITLYNNTISSEGGNVSINGKGAALSNAYGYMGVYMGYNAAILSAAGNITIEAHAAGAASVIAAGWFYGILMIPTNYTNSAYGLTTIESTSGNIVINGSSSHNQNGNHNAGVAMFTQNAAATARVLTYSGNIDISGSNLNVSNPSYAGIFLTGGGNENIVSRTGNITLRGNSSNSSVPGILANSVSRIGYDGVNAYSGDISIMADNINFSNVAAALQSSGNLQVAPLTAGRQTTIGAAGGMTLPVAFFTNNCVDGFNSIHIGSNSYSGNISIAAINFRDNMVFETSGAVTQTGAINASTQRLTLLGSNAGYTLNNAGNSVHSIAANAGTVNYVNSTTLQLGNIITSGSMQVKTLDGNLTLTDNIQAGSTGVDAIRLYADAGKLAGDASGGNIVVQGGVTVTTGIGGRASLYSGSFSGSTGLAGLVGGAANRRMEVDAFTPSFTPALGSGVYALMREAAVLPVGLSSFETQCIGNKVVLNWTTASESENEGFYVEKSNGLLQWEQVTFIKGAGESHSAVQYRYTDPVESGGNSIVYYRLRQVDKNGAISYSSIIASRCNNRDAGNLTAVQAYPNPTTGVVQLRGLPAGISIKYSVFNAYGEFVFTGMLTAATSVIDFSGKIAGLYFIRIHGLPSEKIIQIVKQ